LVVCRQISANTLIKKVFSLFLSIFGWHFPFPTQVVRSGSASRGSGRFAKLLTRHAHDGKAPSILGKRVKVRYNMDLDRFLARMNFDAERRRPKIDLVAATAFPPNDCIGHFCPAPVENYRDSDFLFDPCLQQRSKGSP